MRYDSPARAFFVPGGLPTPRGSPWLFRKSSLGAGSQVVTHAEEEWRRDRFTPDRLIDIPLDRVGLSGPTFNALCDSGIRTAADWASRSDEEILRLQMVGPKVLREIRAAVDRCVDRIVKAQDRA
jgi:DNA-directed RNA polymerase alpha subunit